MASINISEDDFQVVANAAREAQAIGHQQDAEALDKIARKINASLSHNAPVARIARMASGKNSSFSWRDVPSTLL